MENVELDLKFLPEKYDSSNPLVISSKKKAVKVAAKKSSITSKQLSKKQRKKLEKILEKKNKKLNRAELLEKLSKVQAVPEDLEHLTSTADMQTLGVKRFSEGIILKPSTSNLKKISNIKGSRKNCENPPKKLKLDLNFVDFNVESSDSGSESDSTDDGNSPDKLEEKMQAVDSDECVNNILSENEEISVKSNFTSDDSNKIENMIDESKEKNSKEREKECAIDENKNVSVKVNDCDTQESREPAVYVTLNRLPEIQVCGFNFSLFKLKINIPV
ncbi:uncharacterized protein LOC118203335 isoform X2 [Stegodyphus dumicola]|uniref:uncharacterized protein LOC118203335 isoform X2 n=1 Tax=Stegodyphus dumicola TaxID=202533 RepID=UPI0015B1AC8C|nr:uncharacterized protein LOC118203335 isoform X2 [Stegodyphus dumicola]